MGSSVQKAEELEEEAKSYTGLGALGMEVYGGANEFENWVQTTTYPLTSKENSNKTLIKDLLEEFRGWNESHRTWGNFSSDTPPTNEEQFIEQLDKVYQLKKK